MYVIRRLRFERFYVVFFFFMELFGRAFSITPMTYNLYIIFHLNYSQKRKRKRYFKILREHYFIYIMYIFVKINFKRKVKLLHRLESKVIDNILNGLLFLL